MKRERKILTGVLIFMMLSVFIWAGGKQESAAGKAEFRFWDLQYDGFTKPHIMSLEEYMQKNPNVMIKHEAFSDYWTKIPTAVSAGTQGDIVYWMSRDFMPFFINGQFIPLPEEVMPYAELKQTYWPESLPAWEYDGKYYGIPEDYNVEGFALIAVNLTLLKKHGHELPAGWVEKGGPAKFSDLMAFAKKISVKDSSGRITIPGYVGVYDEWDAQKFWALIFQAGGDYRDPKNKQVHFNTPEAKKALSFMYDFVYKQGVTNMDLGRSIVQFISNANAFMAVAAPHWGAKLLMEQPDMEWVMLKTPPIFGSKPYWNVDGGWGYAVSKKTKNPKEAWNIVKYCGQRDQTKRVAIMSGSVPPRKDLAKDPDIIQKMPQAKYFKPMLELAEYGQHVAPYVGDQGQMKTICQEEIEKVLVKEKSVDQALVDMDRRVNEMIVEKWKTFGKK
jgi:multiple sugar transport system substrate-binding protein